MINIKIIQSAYQLVLSIVQEQGSVVERIFFIIMITVLLGIFTSIWNFDRSASQKSCDGQQIPTNRVIAQTIATFIHINMITSLH